MITSVLVAEKDPIIRLLLADLIRTYCPKVEEASNGEELASKATSFDYSIIFVGVSLDKIQSFEAAEVIRTFNKASQIYILGFDAPTKNIITAAELLDAKYVRNIDLPKFLDQQFWQSQM